MLDRLYVFDGYAGWDPEVSFSGFLAIVTHDSQDMKAHIPINAHVCVCYAAVDDHLHLKMRNASLCS